MAECLDKNMIDKDEYPQTAELELRCVNMLAQLWNAPGDAPCPLSAARPSGPARPRCSPGWRSNAGGSSGAAPRGGTARPNLVMGINVQVCWDKFCNYFEVEPRLAPMAGERFHLGAEQAVALCDENTIGVVAILGSTFDGSYEPVAEIAAALDDLQERTGLDVPVHVDGASGGMVAPFLDPDLEWDFRLPRVASINTSGHKYGCVYPGVGWVVWRDSGALPEELIFKVNYLGGEMPTLALNFSRPGGQVVAQYYTFLRLGREGFRRSSRSAATSPPTLSGADRGDRAVPAAHDGRRAARIRVHPHDDVTNYNVFDVSAGLRERGWQVPAYTFPANREDLAALRIVVRNGTGRRWPTCCWTTSHTCCPGCSGRSNRSEELRRRASTSATAQRKA